MRGAARKVVLVRCDERAVTTHRILGETTPNRLGIARWTAQFSRTLLGNSQSGCCA